MGRLERLASSVRKTESLSTSPESTGCLSADLGFSPEAAVHAALSKPLGLLTPGESPGREPANMTDLCISAPIHVTFKYPFPKDG